MLSVFPRRCTYTHRFLVCVGRCESAGLALGRVPQVAYTGSARNLPATPFCVRDIIISLGTVADHSFSPPPPHPLSLSVFVSVCTSVSLCVSVFLSLACKLKTKRQSSLSVCPWSCGDQPAPCRSRVVAKQRVGETRLSKVGLMAANQVTVTGASAGARGEESQ